MVQFTFIDDYHALTEAAKEWKKADIIGIDLECENNLHHYGVYASLVQLSTKDKNWIVDVLTLKDVKPLLVIFEDGSIQKIFHDVGFDLRVLKHQFDCSPRNVFDTQIAALLLGKTELGLDSLLENSLGVRKEKSFQMADWTKRPIKEAMLSYAINDTIHLIALRKKLVNELRAKGRLDWADEDFKLLVKKDYSYNQGGFLDIKGLRFLDDREKAILKRLYNLREKLAKKVDRPVHFIIPIKKMMDFAKSPPKNIGEWKRIRGVHPVVKSHAHDFFEAVAKGKKEKIVLKPIHKPRFTEEQKIELRNLGVIQEKVAAQLGIAKHLVINKEQMMLIVTTGVFGCLKGWQRDLVEKLL
jgi:ribonuclease D